MHVKKTRVNSLRSWSIPAFTVALCAAALFFTVTCNTELPVAIVESPVSFMLRPAPPFPIGFYDHFGQTLSPSDARRRVLDAGLDPALPESFARVGMVHVTPELIEKGRSMFFRDFLGDPLAIGGILNFGNVFGRTPDQILFDSFDAGVDKDGSLSFFRDLVLTGVVRNKAATTNLRVPLSRDLKIGTHVYPAGTIIDTGADVPLGELLPVGFEAGSISCSLCHASVDPLTGRAVAGVPNTDLNARLFVALSSNTTAIFLRLNNADFDPFDDRFPRTGRRIIDSNGNTVQLPDPIAFEQAVDDFLITSVPFGGFEAAPDGVTAVTKIPDNFVFGEGGMGWDGGFNIGPFGGVSAFSNAVHTFELNLLTPALFSNRVADLDGEVYLGMILQNASDPRFRVPDDVRPSEWLAKAAPGAELGRVVTLPTFPNPSLFSLNSLVLSPPNEPFMQGLNALAAFQATLVCPPNKYPENRSNIASGAVERGAQVFIDAGCVSCHVPPFFTDGSITPNSMLGVSPARGLNRRPLEVLLVEAEIPSFDEMVPLSESHNTIVLPPAPGETSNLKLPKGLDGPDGGYKVTGLLGTFFKSPYLHDGSIAVGATALREKSDGGFEIADESRIGVPGTTLAGEPVDAVNSLRALVDRDLRAKLVAANRANENLKKAAIDGGGHEFFVDPSTGFTYRQQADLIAFLMALDDNPGEF